MQTFRTVFALRSGLGELRAGGRTIALVPTMGALHGGHLALITAAAREADHVVASIFVNPRQFGPAEDLDRYPRPIEADMAALTASGVAALWLPDPDEMYPAGFATTVSVGRLGETLCGAARPGHFDGVTTVVAKLLAQVAPDVAVFGEKDWQQLAIVRRMAADLDYGVRIVGVPTVRTAEGLALSSRNAYLCETERAAALALPQALAAARAQLESGASVPATLAAVQQRLLAAGFHVIDYVALVDPDTLQPLLDLTSDGRLLAAARIGATRLIDNTPVRRKI